jgi:hypothetical protein
MVESAREEPLPLLVRSRSSLLCAVAPRVPFAMNLPYTPKRFLPRWPDAPSCREWTRRW